MLGMKLRENSTESSKRLVERAARIVIGLEMQMETWEFLLQREEDTTWLPLESSDVEILEGRYRIVARCGHPNKQMEVRITHHAYEEHPPIRRVQTRTTTTTPEGLMVLIPYTRLKPGIWDFCCSPHQASDPLERSGQQSIKLRVLSEDAELGESPQAIIPEETASATSEADRETLQSNTLRDRLKLVEPISEINTEVETSTEIMSSDEAEITPPEQESAATNEDWIKWGVLSESTPVQSIASELTETPVAPETEDSAELPTVQLTLSQTAYVGKLGEGLLVSGQAQPLEDTEAPTSTIADPHLQVSLRDPQNSEILTEIQQAVPTTTLPLWFSAIVYLPFECKTRLILAEIILYSQTVPLARQTFTITTEVEHLLQAIDEDFAETDELESMAEELPDNPSFYLSLPLEPELELSQFQSIQTPTPKPQPTTGKLDLPALGHFLSEVRPTTSASSETASTPTEASDASLTKIQPSEEIKPLSPVEQEFKHLNTQNRFWTRLNALATDRDLSQWMQKTTPKALPESPLLPTTVDRSNIGENQSLDPLSASIPDDLESQEIVIDDEPLEDSASVFPRRTSTSRLQLTPARDHEAVDLPNALPDNEPVPAPILQILTDELVAGRSVPVRVRLPEDLPRVYIKIWVYDRQARTIIDGPRWLTEFAPNGLDQIETTVNLDIAYGSLEVQIEAIAVEMQTQRESQKVTLERTVMPSAEPSLPLEED
jgi:hypothetical protein